MSAGTCWSSCYTEMSSSGESHVTGVKPKQGRAQSCRCCLLDLMIALFLKVLRLNKVTPRNHCLGVGERVMLVSD